MSSFHRYFSVSSFDRAWGLFVTSAGHTVTKPGAPYPPDQHPPEYQFDWSKGRVLDQFLLMMIGAGQGILETRHAQSIHLVSGDMVLLQPGVLHRYRPDTNTGWEEYWVCFSGLLPEQWRRGRLLKQQTPLLGCEMSFSVRDRFDELIATARQESYSPQVLAALTHAVLSEALFAGALKSSRSSEREALRRAADTIRKHPEDFDLSAFAKAAGISERVFQRGFRLHFGMSPAKFAQEERVAHAKRWLTETDLPLRAISKRLHFSSEFYFMRAFKRSTGKSPGRWRTEIRKSAR